MVKRTIKETISEYDEGGRVIRQTVTETTENDDTVYMPYTYPIAPIPSTPAPWWNQPYCATSDAVKP